MDIFKKYRELFTKGEQEFLMKTKAAKTLRKSMYDEAKKICEEKRKFYDNQADKDDHDDKSIFDMFPFFAGALEELRSSESLLTFQQLHKILSLLKVVITEHFAGKGARLACLHECIPDGRGRGRGRQYVKKGPEDMILALEDGDWVFVRMINGYYDI